MPYEKGALFLKHLEAVYGREQFDAFLKGYFDHFAFQSITTAEFAAYLDEHLLKGDPAKAAQAKVDEWLYEPGLPADAPSPTAAALREGRGAGEGVRGRQGERRRTCRRKTWTTQEWLHFLTSLPATLGGETG